MYEKTETRKSTTIEERLKNEYRLRINGEMLKIN